MYPIALELRDRIAVVVGGGAVAERKVRGLLAARARVRLVAPVATEALATLAAAGEIAWSARAFRTGDLADALLVYAATDAPDVNALVCREARAHGTLVDDTTGENPSDFSTPLVHRTGDVTFAIDTGGSSPSFARRVADELAARFGDDYGRAALALRLARDYVKVVIPEASRAAVMRALAAREIAALAAMNPSTVENEVEDVYERLRAPDAPRDAARTQLVCATRASALAMWQTRHVGALLGRGGLVSTILQISTQGDRVQDRSLAALGTDSIFVKELEHALRDGRADYAVHSCKDLPSTLPDDMRLAAIGYREDPRDAFCSERYPSLDALPAGSLIGTSSPRRRAQLAALRPDLRFETIRGNVDTRLRKLREGAYDAIVLALAGLRRLGLSATYTVPVDPALVVPAVGQGALAVETRANDGELAERIRALLSVPDVELAVLAERAFLRTLRGGCQAPVGAHATVADGTLAMHAAIAAPDGSRIVRGAASEAIATGADAERVGEALARRLLDEGGSAILDAALAADPSEGEPPAPPDAPLLGGLFLLPRTQERASTIAPALRGAGAEVVEASDSEAAAEALGRRRPTVLLFPSSGSVRAVASYLAELQATGERPVVAAMGEASASAAREAGFLPDVVATEPTVAAFVQSITHYLVGRRTS